MPIARKYDSLPLISIPMAARPEIAPYPNTLPSRCFWASPFALISPLCSFNEIGILGGSFDPVHKGHLGIASEVQDKCGLDQILFIPAAQAPLKETPTETPAHERLAMLLCALKEYPGKADISLFELQQEGRNYSIDTVRELKRKEPRTHFSWIIGADQVENLHRWHQIEELAKLLDFIAVSRPGHPPPERPDMPWLKLRHCETRQYSISSTEIRRRIREGLPLDEFLPKTVAEYIRTHHLYSNNT